MADETKPKPVNNQAKRESLAKPVLTALETKLTTQREDLQKSAAHLGFVDDQKLAAVRETETAIKQVNCFVKYPLPWTLVDLGADAYKALAVEGGYVDAVPNTAAFRLDLAPTDMVLSLHKQLQ